MMRRLHAFLRDEGGSATIEFMFVLPIVMTIFLASFEASLYTIRSVMLERSVDMVVRDIRLGIIKDVKAEPFKKAICQRSALITSVSDCVSDMTIYMQPINTADFDMNAPNDCVNTDLAPMPSREDDDAGRFKYGTDNEIVLLRICLKEDPMFPTSAVAAGMTKNHTDRHYALVVTSVFVREPGWGRP